MSRYVSGFLALVCCLPAVSQAPGPVLSYFSTFGSQSGGAIQSLALDAAGNIYVTGTTTGAIPLVNPIQSTPGSSNCSPEPGKTFNACEDVFAAKFDPTGTKLLYSTYLGPSGRNFAAGIAVDAAGNAYVAGTTHAAGFVGTAPRDGQAFLYKLNPTGSAIVYSRYLNGDTRAGAVAVDGQGNAYLAGASLALDFPAVNALQSQAPLRSLFVSNDGGSTWRSLNNGLPALAVNSLAAPRAAPGVLYSATSSGLFKSADAGTHWTRIFEAAAAASLVLADPADPSTLYVIYPDATGIGSLLARSTDAGATWTNLNSSFPPPRIPGAPPTLGTLAIDPSNPSLLWLTTTSYGLCSILKSADRGAHWQDVHDFPAFFVPQNGAMIPEPDGSGILIDPANSSHAWLCCGYSLGGRIPAFSRPATAVRPG